MFASNDFFDLSHTAHPAIFNNCEFVWDVLKKIKDYVATHLQPAVLGKLEGHAWIGDNVFIGEGTIIEDGVMIKGPAIIGKNCEIRHNAYIRENVIIGDNCVIGNSCELKNALLFNNCQVPHFNYVGDSVLGFKAHLGAGVKISNVKLVPGNIIVEHNGQRYDTGLRKFGAIIGDRSEVGCNAVLNPGSVIGRDCVIYPNTFWRGVLSGESIVKNKGNLEIVVKLARKKD